MSDAAAHQPATPHGQAHSPTQRGRFGCGDIALAALVGLVVVAYYPAGFAPGWTPRTVLYLAAFPWLAIGLIRLARNRDRSAQIAVALIGAAVISAVVSQAPWRSLLPVFFLHDSVLVLATGLGAWAVARQRRHTGRTLIEQVFVSAVLVSVLVGLLQVLVGADYGALSLFAGRASGLSLNPVYLGALAGGVVAWSVAARVAPPDFEGLGRAASAVSLVGGSVGVWISGSRIALGAVLLVVLIAGLQQLRHVVVRVVPFVVGGLVLGEFARVAGRSTSGRPTTGTGDRLGGGQVTSGFGVRFEMWGFDRQAILDRPIFGHGLGGHANAVQGHLTPEFVVRTNPDDLLNNWTDAHNIAIGLFTSFGVVGVVLAAAFVVAQLRFLRGPAAWAVAAIAVTWLLQPISMVALVPTMALLGVAYQPPNEHEWPNLSTRTRVAVGAVGVALAGWLIGAEVLLARAERDRTVDAAEQAATWWWHDPMSAREGSVLGLREAVVSGGAAQREAVLALVASMTDRDPAMAFWWVQRGDIEQIFDLDEAARSSYERALEIQPWSRAAMVSLLELDDRPERIADLESRLAELDAEEG